MIRLAALQADGCCCRREEIAECSERAYTSLSVADAKKLMLFASDKEAMEYAQEVSLSALVLQAPSCLLHEL